MDTPLLMFLMNPTVQLVRSMFEDVKKHINHMDHYLLDVVSPPSWKKNISIHHMNFCLVVSIT